MPLNAPTRQNCATATVSLVFGILSWLGLTIPAALIAIVCGHMARGEIRRSQGALEGDGLAVAGLVLGYLHLVLAVLAVICALLFFGSLAALLAASLVFVSHIHG